MTGPGGGSAVDDERAGVRRAIGDLRGHDHFALLFLLLLTTLLLTGVDGRLARTAAAFVNSVVLVIALDAGTPRLSKVRIAGTVALAALGWVTASAFDADEVVGASGWLVQAFILGLITVAVLRQILRHEQVTLQTIAGALSIYVLIGLFFGMVYGAVEATTDEVMLMAADGSREDPVYYSLVTLTTVGFGDVTSMSGLVRRISMVQAIIGQVFLATMVARVVSLYSARRPSRPDDAA